MLETLVNNIIPKNDVDRIAALHRFDILYTSAEKVFDNITQMVAQVFDAPMAFISLVDKEKVFYKSQVGPFGRDEVNREDSLCSLTILGTEPLIIEDASGESCFSNNPYVKAEGGIRFYAGAPLITKEGLQIGTVCIVDIKPRTFSQKEISLLKRFAKLVMHEIEVRYVTLTEMLSAQEVVKANEQLIQLSLESKRSQERFDLVSKATQDAIWDWDLVTNAIWWNEGFKELFGYQAEEIEPTVDSWYNRVHPGDREWVMNSIHDVIDSGGHNWSAEYRFRKKDGSYAIVFDRGYALHDQEGKPYRMLGSMQDITERKKAEETIRESEVRYAGLIHSSPFAIGVLIGPELVITTGNQAILDIWGKDESVFGKPYFEALPELADQGYRDVFNGVYNSGEAANFVETPVHIVQDGKMTLKYYNFILYPQRNGRDKVEGVGIIASEVTTQAKYNQQIRESEARFRTLILKAPVAICIFQGSQYILEIINSQMAELLGREASQIEGRPFFEALPEVQNVGLEEILENVVKNNTTFVSPEQSFQLPRKGNVETVWVKYIYEPMKSDSGEVERIMVLAIDVTPQVRARQEIEEKVAIRTTELAQANDALLRSNQELARSNVNLGEFAYAASHDLKEPIRKIHFFSERIKDAMSDRMKEEEKHYFERMASAAQRMASLIDDLLSYSQISIQRDTFEEVDMNQLMKVVLEDLDLEIEEKGAIIAVDDLFTMKGHHRQLQQAFQNIIGNALKYNKSDIAPRILITYNKVNGKQTGFPLSEVDPERAYHLISIKDNGIGFEQENAERIFNVFTRLHGMTEYKGTGIGLSIVRKVIENHKGYIWAESQPDQGATFKVLLPIA